MQDIDFDELDRAVSSVLGTTPQSKPVVAEPSVAESPTLQATPVVPASPAPAPVVTVREVAPRVATPRPSTGRFMDVFHPSSDMRTATPSPVTPAPAEEPQAQLAVQESAAEEPEAPKFLYEQYEEIASPLESPFLTDAKVEKRPLGAFSNEDLLDTTPLETPLFDPSLEVSEEALIGEIENGDTDPLAAIEEVPAEPVAPVFEEPVVEVPVTQPIVVPEEPIAAEVAPEFNQVLQPTIASIPQQYTEQPSVEQQPSGSIFDTESYHQPLAHPQKKKSGALVIVWILGLIILGAGLGAALYFFVLQGM